MAAAWQEGMLWPIMGEDDQFFSPRSYDEARIAQPASLKAEAADPRSP